MGPDGPKWEEAWTQGRLTDLAHGGRRGPIDAHVIREFCVQRRSHDPRGIRIISAVVSGQLDLAGVDLPVPLRFRDCEFESAPILHGASFAALSMTECRVPGILANGLRVRRDLDLSESMVTGGHTTTASTSKTSAIWLCESQIGGRLLCVDTVIRPDGHRALQADRMRVGGAVRMLRNFEAHGEVRLIGAQLEGSLDFTGVSLHASDYLAVDLSDISIGGSLFIIPDEGSGRAPLIDGRIDLRNARIVGQMLIRGARLTTRVNVQSYGAYDTNAPDMAISAPRASIGGGLTIERATEIIGGLDLSSSELSGLSIEAGCGVNAPARRALDLTNAELRSSVRLDGVEVQGTIRLTGARVGGNLSMGATALSDPDGDSLVTASNVHVAGDVSLRHTECEGGQLEFQRATVVGGFDAGEALLRHPEGATLVMHHATVQGSLRLADGFASVGYVLLNSCVIDGQLDCADATFECPGPSRLNVGGSAIQALSTVARGGMDLGWRKATPNVDFTDATTTVLMDDPRRWPDEIYISGFTYDRLDVTGDRDASDIWSWRERRDWLSKQGIYDASPYEQAAKVFKQHGYTYGAEQILIAQRVHARATIRRGGLRRLTDTVFGWTVGYGYRPGRVLWLLALLLTLVSVTLLTPMAQNTMRATSEAGEVFTPMGPVGGPPQTDACGDGKVRCFHPILYAVDTVVPLMSLDQRDTWYPNPHAPGGLFVEWLLNVSTIVGWLLSTIFVLSFTRLARTL